jgi:exodeoxyribonuclease-3
VRVVTWNVNSIKARLPRLQEWLLERDPDVVCLQETKVRGTVFPELAGYEVAEISGASYNGVAILSKVGLCDVQSGFVGDPGFGGGPEPRAIGATCGGVRVWSLYVPNGRTLDDAHYEYKLAWLQALTSVIEAELASHEAMVVCGDWNIAPTDADVWDIRRFDGATHVSALERAAYQGFLSLGLVDTLRQRWPQERVFTYWDYRAGMFQRDEGMRIDHLLATPQVAARRAAVWVDRAARKGKGPSDHAPVVLDLDIAPDGDLGPLVPPPSVKRR